MLYTRNESLSRIFIDCIDNYIQWGIDYSPTIKELPAAKVINAIYSNVIIS